MKRPVLIDNWKACLTSAWSVLLLYVVIALNGLEILIVVLGLAVPGPFWLRAALSVLVSSLALYSRLIWQPRLKGKGR